MFQNMPTVRVYQRRKGQFIDANYCSMFASAEIVRQTFLAIATTHKCRSVVTRRFTDSPEFVTIYQFESPEPGVVGIVVTVSQTTEREYIHIATHLCWGSEPENPRNKWDMSLVLYTEKWN